MGFRSDLYGSVPGQNAAQETYENHFRWGRDAAGVIVGVQLDPTTRDAGNTPTSVLRPGLLLSTLTASGNAVHYSPSATDGSDQAVGVLLSAFRMTNLDGTDVPRFAWMLAGGPVKAARLIGLDEQARAQMAGRFTFDDRSYLPNLSGFLRTIAKPTGYTVLAADNNTHFTTTGAGGAVTFVLPAPAKGLRYRFSNTVNQNMVIQAPSGKLIGLNNAAATTLTFSTSNQKIGAAVEVLADEAGNEWIAHLMTNATATYA